MLAMMNRMIGLLFEFPFQTSRLCAFYLGTSEYSALDAQVNNFVIVCLLMCVLINQSRKYEVDRLLLREKRLESMPKRGECFLMVTLWS